jgi:N-acyl-D-amino-acid deacylase
MFDLLIKNGQIIDGTANPGYFGAVAVTGDRLQVLRGDISVVKAKKIIDAAGRVVCPGFIDIHSHSGLVMLANPKHEPKTFQGVTTETIGIDGISWAPIHSWDDLKKHVHLNAGVDGELVTTEQWRTVSEFLELYDRKVACNVAYLVGNNPLRTSAIGWDDRRATRDEIKHMQELLEGGLEEGAFALSTGLDYPPGSYADTDELVELCKVVAKKGGFYHSHVRYNLGDKFIDPYLEALEIGRRSGCAVHLTHMYQRLPFRGPHQRLLEMVDKARAEGMDVTFDNQPYNLMSGTLILVFPQWARAGGPDAFLDLLKSKDVRKRFEKEVQPQFGTWHEWWLTNFQQPKNKRWEGKSVAEISEMSGRSIVDTICDLLIDEDLHISYVVAGFNPATQPIYMQHPAYMVGTDSIALGAFPSPRTYGTYPLILGSFVREEKFLTLPEAIRKMTSAPAQRLGLKGRGLLKDGFKADLVIFDPAKVAARANQHEPREYPVGIDYVICNGTVIVDHNQHTGALPGRALRRGQD